MRDEPVRDQLMQAVQSATQPVTYQDYWDLMDDNFLTMYLSYLSDSPTISSEKVYVLWQCQQDYDAYPND